MSVLRTMKFLCKFSTNIRQSVRYHSIPTDSNTKLVLQTISSVLSCNGETALSVYKSFPSNRSVGLGHLKSQLDENTKWLTTQGVSKQVISANPFLLNLEIGTLQRKWLLITQMQPKHIDDFVPLLDMQEPILRDVATISANECDVIPEKHRIYYLSKELQIAPVIVSKFCSKAEVMFFARFPGIAKKLNILLDYNVEGRLILQSLYILQYASNVIVSRLEDLIANGVFNIKLWYLGIPDKQFRKILVSEANNAQSTTFEMAQSPKKWNPEKLVITKDLNLMLSCDDKVSAQIYYDFVNNIDQLALAKSNCKLLIDNGVSLELIQTNAGLLSLPNVQIMENIELIKQMKPQAIGDFLPLVTVDTKKLTTFTQNALKRQTELHPVYYFSKTLNIAPTIVSKYFAKYKNYSIFRCSNGFEKKLQLLVAHNVQPISILTSPKIFDTNYETLESTLMDLKRQGIDKVRSWMLVCGPSQRKRAVARQIEEKESISESANTVEYVAKRLNWDEAAKERALNSYPQLANRSVIKVKAHLDYLLNETHFTVDDINSMVWVFRANLDELKLRMAELTAIGLVPRKLWSLCYYRRKYLGMVERFCKKKNCQESFRLIERRIKK